MIAPSTLNRHGSSPLGMVSVCVASAEGGRCPGANTALGFLVKEPEREFC
ncbi:hypothetical protein USDA257_c37410 [Sinorhizobium fredii USDA 257]|uniref:Uncharacterized protein n=1 Tax=Sinorhizobium fredii (strain USDA 257) TaxID=1185652 RepID=I3X8T4_SINF2|nr:hypothetical protein USDA257_c37410 [Sinorhizobium fredii USDA 257]